MPVVLRLDLADDVGRELAAVGIDLTRLQRASERAQHSTGGRRDHVIDRRRVRLSERRRVDLVVLGNGAVRAETDGLRFAWKRRGPQGTALRTRRIREV